MSQNFDLAGAIEYTYVPTTYPLLPVFEAIANAIDAIRERALADGRIRVEVVRGSGQMSLDLDKTTRPSLPITGFNIIDNGVGFNDDNVGSFMTRYSRRKASSWGKGLGRFVWFRTFKSVEIHSHYSVGSRLQARKWLYQRGDDKLRQWEDVAPTSDTPGTVISLRGWEVDYATRAPKRTDTIAYRIIEHFLVYYVLDALPKLTIEDLPAGDTLDAQAICRGLIVASETGKCAVSESHELTVKYLLLRHHSELPGAIVYCAKQRAVDTHSPDTVIPDVPEAFTGEDGTLLSFRAYVSGPLLEGNVDPLRTGFRFDDGSPRQRRLFPELPTWLELRQTLQPGCEGFLAPHIATARTDRDDRVDRHLEEAPWYRNLLAARPDTKTRIPTNASHEGIEMSLYKETLHWRGEIHQRGARILEELKSEGDDFNAVRERLWEHQNTLKTSALDDLARYVYHRRAVLLWLEKYLKYIKDERQHVSESIVHDLFFRRGTDSTTTGYFSHNLWVISDDLTFHQYAASDMALSAYHGHAADSRKEPDVVTYSRAIFTERDDEEAECRSVVIIEFKKPGRIAYGSKDDPVQQVRTYCELIATKTRKADDGSTIDVGQGTRYYGYVIADPSNDLVDFAKHYSMRPLPNGSGWARHFSEDSPQIYVEMLTYNQALTTAKRRNAAFFHLLGVRGSIRP